MKIDLWEDIQSLCESFECEVIFEHDNVAVLGKPEHIKFKSFAGWEDGDVLEKEELFYCPLSGLDQFFVWVILPLKYKDPSHYYNVENLFALAKQIKESECH